MQSTPPTQQCLNNISPFIWQLNCFICIASLTRVHHRVTTKAMFAVIRNTVTTWLGRCFSIILLDTPIDTLGAYLVFGGSYCVILQGCGTKFSLPRLGGASRQSRGLVHLGHKSTNLAVQVQRLLLAYRTTSC